MIGRLKSVQDDLGEQQDLVVAVRTLRELAISEDLPPQAVFSIGSMAGRYARDAEQIRSGFLDSKKLRVLKADLSRYGLPIWASEDNEQAGWGVRSANLPRPPRRGLPAPYNAHGLGL
jgi:hypothetical protein